MFQVFQCSGLVLEFRAGIMFQCSRCSRCSGVPGWCHVPMFQSSCSKVPKSLRLFEKFGNFSVLTALSMLCASSRFTRTRYKHISKLYKLKLYKLQSIAILREENWCGNLFLLKTAVLQPALQLVVRAQHPCRHHFPAAVLQCCSPLTPPPLAQPLTLACLQLPGSCEGLSTYFHESLRSYEFIKKINAFFL